jgi:hypothetical protein
MLQLELVVARYQEDLAWLKRVPRDFRVTIYDKNEGEHWEGSIPLPNLGREAHTYLHHIIKRYESLADLTVFCQGKPFDHAYDFRHQLIALAKDPGAVTDFRWMGHIMDTDDNRGRRLFVPWSKNEDGRELDIAGAYRALFAEDGPETFTFYLGAQFAVTGDLIRRRPRSFYEQALEVSLLPDAAHCFERMWDRVFGVQGVADEWQGQTKYLKPIRRLDESGAGAS